MQDDEDEVDEPWREPDPIVISPPKFKVVIGSKVVACNVEAMNRDTTSCVSDANGFYEEGEVVDIHDEYICDVRFPNGDILKNAKINSFKDKS